MAALSDANRVALWADLMRRSDVAYGEVTKPDLRAAVDAVDAWVDANAATYNAAIPQPARGALNARQKAALLAAVLRARFEQE